MSTEVTEQPEKKRWIRLLVPTIKLAVFGILCWAIYKALDSGSEQLSQHEWHVEPEWLVVSGLLYLAAIFPPAIFWYRLLLQIDQQVSFGDAGPAYYISQLGKYVPGKWMVVLLRRVLLRSGKVENTVVAASVFFETFTMLAVGSAISAIVLVIWHPHQTLLIALAGFSVLLLGLPTAPALFERILRVLKVTKLNPTAGRKFRKVTWGLLFTGWGLMALSWVMQGISLWATLRAVGAVDDNPFKNLSMHTTAVALSIVAGFLSQIPGGLAVREWVSAELIKPEYGESVAIVSAILYRLVLVVSELSVSIILYVVGWWRNARSVSVPEAGNQPV